MDTLKKGGTSRASARAIVKVEVEIDAGDSWGADCTVDQVQRQSVDSAVLLLTQTLSQDSLCQLLELVRNDGATVTIAQCVEMLRKIAQDAKRIRIVGKPTSRVVVLTEDK
jgi:hypothetical protein